MDEKKKHKSHKNSKRSRSRSLNKGKHKKDEKKTRKYSSDSSRSSNSRNNFDKKLNKLRKETHNNKKERNSEHFIPKMEVKLPNKNILANIIKDNIKTNKKLDTDELNRATVQLKTVDSKRTPVLMTSHINSTLTRGDNFSYEFQDGEYNKLPKDYSCEINNCKEKFTCFLKLFEHIQTFHPEQI